MPTLKLLKDALSNEVMNRFSNTCFKNFLDLDPIWFESPNIKKGKFSGKLIHYVMTKKVKSQKFYKMWFDFDEKLAQFSINEFVLVTGFKCTSRPEILKRLEGICLKEVY